MAPQKPTTPKNQGPHTSSTKNPAKPQTPKTPYTELPLEDKRRGNPYGWPLVEILWIDAISDGLYEWLDPEDLQTMKPEDSLVVGYLAHQTPEYIIIASLINDDTAAHALCIPRNLIINLTPLKPK